MTSAAEPSPPGLWRGLVAHPRFGRVPLVLLVLTVVTGAVDAVSILGLGRVFVANMTGNVVFVGFALAGAHGFSLGASLSALVGFLVGAAGGGSLSRRLGDRWALLVRVATLAEVLLVGVALVATAVAMGAQNAVARHLAVPDLTTTVLTVTLTGIAADLRSGRTTALAAGLAWLPR